MTGPPIIIQPPAAHNGPSGPRSLKERLNRRGDRDPAPRLLAQRDVHGGRVELECRRNLVAQLHRERLAEDALVMKARRGRS